MPKVKKFGQESFDEKPELLDKEAEAFLKQGKILVESKTEEEFVEAVNEGNETLAPVLEKLAETDIRQVKVSDTVYFYSQHGEGPWAAIVTKVKGNGVVDLFVMAGHESPFMTPAFPKSNVRFSNTRETDVWQWPN